jgi:siroheme synthase
VLTTGHAEDSGRFDLAPLRADETLALYMGVAQYGEIAGQLIDIGSDPETPVAVIERGTTESQRVISTVLRKLPDAARDLEIAPPALLLVGETTKLAERYAWFAPESLVLYKDEATERLAKIS